MKLLVLTLKGLLLLFLVFLIIGCEAQSQTDSPTDLRRARLVNLENLRLNDELNKRDEEIKTLNASLDQCHQQTKQIADFLVKIPDEYTEQISKLNAENDMLKAKIAQLKTQSAEPNVP